MDLSRYVRVGRYDLPEPTRTTPPDGTSLLAQEASAVTYDCDTDTLFVVGDGGTSVVQVTKTGVLIDSMTLAPGGSPQGTEFYDTEGISYVGGVFRSQILCTKFRALIESEAGNVFGAPVYGPAAGALIEAYRRAGKSIIPRNLPPEK